MPIELKFTKNIDLSWAVENTSHLVKKYTNREYILLFPFCSPKLKNKKWPYYKELIQKLKQEFRNKYSVLLAPGPNEIKEANSFSVLYTIEENEFRGNKNLQLKIKDIRAI